MVKYSIPDHWDIDRLDNYGDFYTGVTYKKSDAIDVPKDDYLPVLRANNINSGLNFHDLVYVPKEKIKDKQVVRKDDIIICMSSGSKNLVGKAAQARSDFKGSFGAFCGLFRCSKDIYANYIGYYFQSQSYRNHVSQVSKGISINNLRRDHIESLQIPIPPKPEQEEIVLKIEELFTQLDAGVAELQEAKARLERYRQSVLKAAVSGELSREWREAHQDQLEPADQLLERILAERRAKWEEEEWAKLVERAQKKVVQKERKAAGLPYYFRDMVPEDWEHISEKEYKKYLPKDGSWKEKYKLKKIHIKERNSSFPDSWAITSLNQISEKITDGTHHTPQYTNSGIAFISVKDIYDGQLHFDNCKYISEETHYELINRCHPEEQDILVTKSGTIGRTAIVKTKRPFSLFVSVLLIKPIKKFVRSEFVTLALNSYFNSIDIQQEIKGGIIKNLHIEDSRNIMIPFPTIAEQQVIVGKVDRRLSVADEIEKEIKLALLQSDHLRQSILKQAFEGKLV